MTPHEARSLGRMANVLDSEKQQQILALGRLGWTLRRIEQETGVRRETASHYLKQAGVRRETASHYLKQAGIEVRPPGRWGHPAAKAASRGVHRFGRRFKTGHRGVHRLRAAAFARAQPHGERLRDPTGSGSR